MRAGRGAPLTRGRLIFTCCHPALAPDARIALTLRLLGGLRTHEIARAFLLPEAMARAPAEALRIVDELAADRALDGYHLLHSTRAELLLRLGRREEAAAEFEQETKLTANEVELAHLRRRRSAAAAPSLPGER